MKTRCPSERIKIVRMPGRIDRFEAQSFYIYALAIRDAHGYNVGVGLFPITVMQWV